MKPSLKQIEAEAKAIRHELCSRYKLKRQQIAALPSVEKLSELAQIANYEILPLFGESIMTKEDREWMEKDKSSQPLSDILKEMGPPREIHFNDAQANQFDLISKLSFIHISLLFALNDPFSGQNPEQQQQAQMQKKLNVLTAYEEACVELIESGNQTDQEKSQYAYFLSNRFPVPSDESLTSPVRDTKKLIGKHGRSFKKPEQ